MGSLIIFFYGIDLVYNSLEVYNQIAIFLAVYFFKNIK